MKAQGVELTEGSDPLSISTAEGKTSRHYLMPIKIVFTQVIEKEPASGLAVGNAGTKKIRSFLMYLAGSAWIILLRPP